MPSEGGGGGIVGIGKVMDLVEKAEDHVELSIKQYVTATCQKA